MSFDPQRDVPPDPGQIVASMRLVVARLRFQIGSTADRARAAAPVSPPRAPLDRRARPA